MEDLEIIINRFIIQEISKIKAPDKDYTTQYLKGELDKLSKYLIAPNEFKSLYNKYRRGVDVMKMLNSNDFYKTLSPKEFPSLFKVPKNIAVSELKKDNLKDPISFRESFSMHDEGFHLPILIDENIPKIKEVFTNYIAFMELKRWIDTKGIEVLPIIIEKAQIKQSEQSGRKKNAKTDLVLKDIWEQDINGTKKEYDSAIQLLKTEYKDIQSPFISEINKKYSWNKIPSNGWVQYMVGFIYTCIDKKWILKKYSAPQLKEILCRTFDVNFDNKPFKSIASNPPADKYLQPFKSIKENK